MKILICVVFVVGLLKECVESQEMTPTIEELKEAAVKWKGDIPCLKRDCSCAFKSQSCCCANTDLQSLKDQVSETFKDMSSQISQLSDEIDEVIEPVNVAFTAFLSHKTNCLGPFERNISIRYDDIRLNDGMGYNSMMGLFTAPVTGVYSFSLTVYARLLRAGQHMFHRVQLMMNGQMQAATWEDNAEDMEDSSSFRVLLSLEQGDQVYAELVHDRQLCGNVQGQNSFSGYLVYPLPATSI